MTIKVKLFGDLRKKSKQEISGTSSLKLEINNSEINKILDVLKIFTIEEEEVSHIFVNGRYAGLRKNVVDGDTVSLFPRNMALLYKWYFNREEDE